MKFLTAPRLVAATIVGGVCAFAYFTEWVEIETDAGFSRAAFANPYLAATQFVDRFGVSVQLVRGLSLLDELPSTDDLMLFASSRVALSDRRTQALLEWVEQGGRLILLATSFFDADRATSHDPLLDYFGIELAEVAQEGAAQSGFIAAIADNLACRDDSSVIEVRFADDDESFTAAFTTDRYLDYDGVRAQLVRVSHGDGWVVAVTTMRLWRNRQIGCHDNAHVLRMLVAGAGGARGAKLWWLYDTQMPPLWTLVWNQYAALVLALALMLVLWIWREGFRMSPATPAPSRRRRAVLEHVTGVARFYWQQRRSDGLLKALRQDVMGNRSGPSLDKLIENLAARTPYSASAIHDALLARVGRDDERFVETVRILQTIRKAV